MLRRIDHVQVGYTVDTGQGPQQVAVDLAAMIRHCRPERVQDLVEDLALMCEEVLARRHPEDRGSHLSVVWGARD